MKSEQAETKLSYRMSGCLEVATKLITDHGDPGNLVVTTCQSIRFMKKSVRLCKVVVVVVVFFFKTMNCICPSFVLKPSTSRKLLNIINVKT